MNNSPENESKTVVAEKEKPSKPAPQKQKKRNTFLSFFRFIGIVFICVFEEIGKFFAKVFNKLRSTSLSLKVAVSAILIVCICVPLVVVLASMVSFRDGGDPSADCIIGADKHVMEKETQAETVPSPETQKPAETQKPESNGETQPPAPDTEQEPPQSDTESPAPEDNAPEENAPEQEPSNVSSLPEGRYVVTVDYYSKEDVRCVSGERTVGELFALMDISLTSTDVLREGADTVISSDTVIHVDEISYGTVKETTEIPYETEYYDVQTIPRGTESTSRRGVLGSSVVEYSVTYVNGVETERTKSAEYISTYPVSAVVYRGTGGTIDAGGQTLSYSYYLDCDSTMYYSGGITASGLPADENVVAVDPRVIPLGTRLYIPGIGIRIAADTGGAIKGNIVDICFDADNPMAAGYGRRYVKVYILD